MVIRVIYESPDGKVRDPDGNLVEDDERSIRLPPGVKRL